MRLQTVHFPKQVRVLNCLGFYCRFFSIWNKILKFSEGCSGIASPRILKGALAVILPGRPGLLQLYREVEEQAAQIRKGEARMLPHWVRKHQTTVETSCPSV